MTSGPRRVLVVFCHPLPDSFVAEAHRRALAGLATTDAEVRSTDLYAEGFRPEFSAAEHRTHLEPGVGDDIASHADDLTWCDTMVLVYPTWWSGQPAMMKGWIDRVWASGVAWDLPDGANRLRPQLHDIRRIVAVTTHGSSKLVNSLQGEGGKRTLSRSLRAMCSRRTRTTWIALYGIDTCSDARRVEFLERVESEIASLAR